MAVIDEFYNDPNNKGYLIGNTDVDCVKNWIDHQHKVPGFSRWSVHGHQLAGGITEKDLNNLYDLASARGFRLRVRTLSKRQHLLGDHVKRFAQYTSKIWGFYTYHSNNNEFNRGSGCTELALRMFKFKDIHLSETLLCSKHIKIDVKEGLTFDEAAYKWSVQNRRMLKLVADQKLVKQNSKRRRVISARRKIITKMNDIIKIKKSCILVKPKLNRLVATVDVHCSPSKYKQRQLIKVETTAPN